MDDRLIYQLRRAVIIFGLALGPLWFAAGTFLDGHLPQGQEWLETVLLVPAISLFAAGAAAGFFAALELLRRHW